MGIILAILQILGWILLSVLLIVLAVLLIVVFSPVHYLIEGEWLEEKWAKFKVHWLLHLFRARISYGDDLIYGEIYIFWKKITFSHDLSEVKEDIQNAEEDVEEALEENGGEITENIPDDIAEEIVVDVPEDDEEPVKDMMQGENAVIADKVIKEDEVSAEDKISVEEDKESIVSKIKGILESIKEIYSRIKPILNDEQNRDAVRHLKNEIIYLLKIFIPKKSEIDAVFSTGSPDTTGQAFGVLACFPVMYRNEWKLMPDFQADEAYFKGTFRCKGWIAVYQFVGIVLRILFDKNCRRLYTVIKKFLKWIKKDDKSEEEK